MIKDDYPLVERLKLKESFEEVSDSKELVARVESKTVIRKESLCSEEIKELGSSFLALKISFKLSFLQGCRLGRASFLFHFSFNKWQ